MADKLRKHDGLNAAKAMIAPLGFQVTTELTNGGHACLLVHTATRVFKFYTGSTPSCAHSARNFCQDVRRGLRQAGFQL